MWPNRMSDEEYARINAAGKEEFEKLSTVDMARWFDRWMEELARAEEGK